MNRCTWLVVAAAALSSRLATAQSATSHYADSLIRRGMLERAESVYYAASRRAPRDPEARRDLGLHLIARGAVRIGTTLLEEAAQFGADRQMISHALYDSYLYLNNYEGIAKLSLNELAAGSRRRIAWLATHPTRNVAPDSLMLIALARSPIDSFIGITPWRLNGVTVKAHIQPATRCKIKLSDTSAAATRLRRFPDQSDRANGYSASVADSVGLGRATIVNVPIDVVKLPRGVEAVVCLGELMPFAPTFDWKAGLMTIRMSGNAPRPSPLATVLPFYAIDGRMAVFRAGGLVDVTAPALRPLLGENRWTLDAKRGQIVLDGQRP